MYEMETLEKVLHPVANTKLIDPEGSTYTWYCESNENTTTIWANFHTGLATKSRTNFLRPMLHF